MRGKLCRPSSAHFPLLTFNEARALCAGSSKALPAAESVDSPSMRPAHYAREVWLPLTEGTVNLHPSMRPAHYAREVGRPAAGAGRHRNLQ